MTLDHARRLLDEGLPLLDAALEAGLSGPSRLHDLFVTHEAISPGEYKSGGEGLLIAMVFTPRHSAGAGDGDRARALRPRFAMRRADQASTCCATGAKSPEIGRWPRSRYAIAWPEGARKIRLHLPRARALSGSLVTGPAFRCSSSARISRCVCGKPCSASPWAAPRPMAPCLQARKAERGARVGAAVGRNPISFVVPAIAWWKIRRTHRLSLGPHAKRAMLGWEAGRVGG